MFRTHTRTQLLSRCGPWKVGIALAAGLLLLGVATGSRADDEAEKAQATMQCKAEWADSPASDSCSDMQIDIADDDDCVVSAMCTSGEAQSLTTITVALGSVSGLHNCAGTLTDGDC